MGAGFDTVDASCKKEVAGRDGGNPGLVFAADSQVGLPCDADVVDKLRGRGIPRDHPRGITARESGANTASPFNHRKEAIASPSGPDLQEVISAGGNKMLVFEDGKREIVKKPEPVGFNGLEKQVFTLGSNKGASDDRRRGVILIVEDGNIAGRP